MPPPDDDLLPDPPPPGEDEPPTEPAGPPMLSAAVFGAAGASGDVTIARGPGSDADFALFFERCARKLRGEVP